MKPLIEKIDTRWKKDFCGLLELEKFDHSSLHFHTFFEFEFAVSGSLNHTINNAASTFSKGDIWLINPATVHRFYPSSDAPEVTRYLLTFDSSFISDEIWKAVDINQFPLCLHLEGDDFLMIQSVFNKIHLHSKNNSLPKTVSVKWSLEWLILFMFDSLMDKNKTSSSCLQPALVYIQNHFREKIFIEDVAATVFFSPEHFSRVFHQYVGMSYREYLLSIRLSHACDLLHSKRYTINEVCYNSGFNTPEYFSRAFKKKFGISPERYRKNLISRK